jgi:hypothetical protein
MPDLPGSAGRGTILGAGFGAGGAAGWGRMSGG